MPLRFHRDTHSSESSTSSPNTREDRISQNGERSTDRQSSVSRHHSRSPHRHSHSHRHSHRRRRFRLKHKERNFLAAVCSMVVIVVLCTAMAEPNWFNVRGGGCRDKENNEIHTMGVYQFFYLGHFEIVKGHNEKESAVKTDSDIKDAKGNIQNQLAYQYSTNAGDLLVDCVTPRVVQVMRSIIALCFIGIAFSLMGFFLDLTGPSSHSLKILRRNAVFNILTVVVCVTINGFSFLVTQLLEGLQNDTKTHLYSKVEIRFDISFYLIAAAGGMSVIASACNLLRRYPPYDHSAEQRENLLDDYDGMDFGLPQGPPGPDFYSPMSYMPPPPAYSP